MRWSLIVASAALGSLAAALAWRGAGESHQVLEADAGASRRASTSVAALQPPDAGSARDGAAVDRVHREGLLDEDELPQPGVDEHPEDVLPPGFSIELPSLRTKSDDLEVESPLPEDYELEAFDGPLVRAEYEDGTLWFEAQRSLDADGKWERDGMWNCWHSNGELHEQGEYRAGVAHGPWSWWYPDGNRMATGNFANGQRTGSWTWYFDTGDLAMKGRYANDRGVGTWTLYYPSGGRHAEGAFDETGASGHWTVWTENGAIDPERTGEYRDGVKVE
ncbi:MAG: hypothetical protein H6831_10615 [Planctomycetes bacterium]|nr:hypothetical protein [Planctomycetota bacterium]MCB9904848.1 hypothetical protein [Planctomycetota bacterium]